MVRVHALKTKQTNYKLSRTYVHHDKNFAHLHMFASPPHSHHEFYADDDDKNNIAKFKVLLQMNYHFHVLIMSHNYFGIFADDALSNKLLKKHADMEIRMASFHASKVLNVMYPLSSNSYESSASFNSNIDNYISQHMLVSFTQSSEQGKMSEGKNGKLMILLLMRR
ncbi:CLUMA_CG020641, isoform A [Clunio marinus]|uniref:CLUMA_CG020641, isoform A n=1 Tax=Clunio marinus TaxID=568069 RepID=A0A1J1J7C8_9DIPT|nr:CLUMA_CG020641, isoform A [Clunio marinus]